MATNVLADETPKYILDYELHVPDEDFASDAEVSPFAGHLFSPSDVLLVCKRWMRIATSLLYHTAVLRSTTQAQALFKTSRRNPELGDCMRKLAAHRGRFWRVIGKVLLDAEGLRVLCLTFRPFDNDNIESVCDVLPMINPRRLVLLSSHTFLLRRSALLATLS